MTRERITSVLERLLQNEEISEIITTKYLNFVENASDNELERKTLGFTEESLTRFILSKIEMEKSKSEHTSTRNIKLNDYFEYGINDDIVHIHLPKDLHEEFKKLGKKKAIAEIGIYLIDAVNRINSDRNNNINNLKNCDRIYMISPIFYSGGLYPTKLRNSLNNSITVESPILSIFKKLGLKTRTITSQTLQKHNPDIEDNEIELARKHFGEEKDVGSASLSFDELNTKKWQKRLRRFDKLLRKYTKQDYIKE